MCAQQESAAAATTGASGGGCGGGQWPGLAVEVAWPACESVWRWHLGAVPHDEDFGERLGAEAVRAQAAELLSAGLGGASEGERTAAAYKLGMEEGQLGLELLEVALCSVDNEAARRAGAHGLAAAGDSAVPVLLRVRRRHLVCGWSVGAASQESRLSHSQLVIWWQVLGLSLCDAPLWSAVVGSAVEALGEAAVTSTARVVEALVDVMAAQAARIDDAPAEDQPDFLAGDFLVDTLQVPVLLPVRHRAVALRFLVLAHAQTALGVWPSRPATLHVLTLQGVFLRQGECSTKLRKTWCDLQAASHSAAGGSSPAQPDRSGQGCWVRSGRGRRASAPACGRSATAHSSAFAARRGRQRVGSMKPSGLSCPWVLRKRSGQMMRRRPPSTSTGMRVLRTGLRRSSPSVDD